MFLNIYCKFKEKKYVDSKIVSKKDSGAKVQFLNLLKFSESL